MESLHINQDFLCRGLYQFCMLSVSAEKNLNIQYSQYNHSGFRRPNIFALVFMTEETSYMTLAIWRSYNVYYYNFRRLIERN